MFCPGNKLTVVLQGVKIATNFTLVRNIDKIMRVLHLVIMKVKITGHSFITTAHTETNNPQANQNPLSTCANPFVTAQKCILDFKCVT